MGAGMAIRRGKQLTRINLKFPVPVVFGICLIVVFSGDTFAAGQGGSVATASAMPQPPLPLTISPAARKQVRAALEQEPDGHQLTIEQQRVRADTYQAEMSKQQLENYGVKIEDAVVAGVPVRIFTPHDLDPRRKEQILVNVHGGGFVVDSGSLTENIPLAAMTRRKVIAVLYRLAPEHPFPAAVDDAVAVYGALLRTYKAGNMILYGTSAGAILSAQTIQALKDKKLPLPAAVGFFSGTADFTRMGDSEQYLPKLMGMTVREILAPYAGSKPLGDPHLSPLFSDLRGFPPTLLITGTRDVLLSQTSIFHRALLKADVDADLVVFEAMPHAHWVMSNTPETREAFDIMARYFRKRLGD